MADEDNPAGCLFVVGIIIVGLAVGAMFGAAYGWLLIGVILILMGFGMARL
jgi:hypothetical protein